MAYLTELRLRRAAGYLSTTAKSVREIAHLTGYDNEASFSKAFSRLFGRRPASTGASGSPFRGKYLLSVSRAGGSRWHSGGMSDVGPAHQGLAAPALAL